MLSLEEYTGHDAIGLADLRASGDITASELLSCALSQARRANPALNAIVHMAADEAKLAAAKLDKDCIRGPLAGVPLLVKEVNAVQGWPHTRSSQLFGDEKATADSAVVNRYRQHGLVPFASTNTPELCLTVTTEHSLFGPSRNPHNLEHSCGGSSGGAAAAVAAGIVPVADGSDGGGSIRIPAACCGLIGLKPSRGLTVVQADMGSSWSGMSVSHVITRSVRDSAAFLDALRLDKPELFALPPERGSFYANHSRSPGTLRIAIQCEHPAGLPVHKDCQNAVEQAAKSCQALGHHIEDASLPIDYDAVGRAMSTLINVHTAQIVAPALQAQGTTLQSAGLATSTQRMVDRGMACPAAQYLKSLDILKHAERQMQAFHDKVDIILSPVLAQPPAPLGWLDMNAGDIKDYARRYAAYTPFTALYNGTGQPSLSLPLHNNAQGLPIGVMFSAAWGQDLQLLQLAHSLLPALVPIAGACLEAR